MWLFGLFIIVPIIEIGLFIRVGGWIGLWPTLGIVIGMALVGSWLLRVQGMLAFADVQRSLRDLRDPSDALGHGLLIVFAGLLMITPGFFTDLIGLTLLVRPVRSLVLRRLARQMTVSTPLSANGSFPRAGRPDIVDGVFYEVDLEPDGIAPPQRDRH